MAVRTDLALELAEGRRVQQRTQTMEGFSLHTVTVTESDTDFGRPPGQYATLSIRDLLRRETDAFPRACRAVAQILRQLAPSNQDPRAPVLVIGLGNRAVTPDAHRAAVLSECAGDTAFGRTISRAISCVSAGCGAGAGVLGTTGVETGELVLGVIDRIHPELILAVDALAARRLSRLMCTIQMTDTGIVPGSGVGNARTALTQTALGVPVLSIGVPTVVDGATLAADIAQQSGAQCEALDDLNTPVLVTTRDVDQQTADAARVIGYGINLFLHPSLDIADMELFLS